MKHRSLFAMALFAVAGAVSAQEVVGRWEFDGNLDAVVGGNAEAYVLDSFGSAAATPSFAQSTIGGQTADVFNLAVDRDFFRSTALRLTHAGGPTGGGTAKLGTYTLVMDVRFDQVAGFISLLQTDLNPKGNDGDWFIRGDGGMGISGNYTDTDNPLRFLANQWQRIVLVNDTRVLASGNQRYFSFVDGALQNQVQSPSGWGVDGRYGLLLGSDPFWLFADEDFEVENGQVNSVVLIDGALTPGQIAELGGPQASGIAGKALSGAITLADTAKTPNLVRVAIESAGSTLVQDVVEADAQGRFHFYSARTGTYDVVVKPRGFLSRRFSAAAFPALALDATYVNGDIDDDNAITVFDYDKLSANFDKSDADADWNLLDADGVAPRDADLDGDGSVTVFDYDLLSTNFDLTGE